MDLCAQFNGPRPESDEPLWVIFCASVFFSAKECKYTTSVWLTKINMFKYFRMSNLLFHIKYNLTWNSTYNLTWNFLRKFTWNIHYYSVIKKKYMSKYFRMSIFFFPSKIQLHMKFHLKLLMTFPVEFYMKFHAISSASACI